eukprot:scaffold5744_cov159-Amphora_coffeaeformis.AAC.5
MNSNDSTIDYYHWSYTDAQSIALCLATSLTGCLSLFGSASIAYSILSDRVTFHRLYERFVLAVSIADIICTLGLVAGLYSVPSHTGMAWAFGNTASCSFSAFLFVFLVSVSWTNGSLAMYFYVTVCLGWKDEYIAKYYERPLHATGFILSTAVGIAAITTKTTNPFSMTHTCAMEDYPPHCFEIDEIDCIRGNGNAVFVWAVMAFFQVVPTIAAIFAIVRVTKVVTQSTRRAYALGSDAALHRQQHAMQHARMYLASYVNTFSWTIVLGVLSIFASVGDVHKAWIYPIIFLCHFMLPLQGFFNYFIYKRRQFHLNGCCRQAWSLRESGSLDWVSRSFRAKKARSESGFTEASGYQSDLHLHEHLPHKSDHVDRKKLSAVPEVASTVEGIEKTKDNNYDQEANSALVANNAAEKQSDI